MNRHDKNRESHKDQEPKGNEYVTRDFLQKRWKASESTIKRMEVDGDPERRLKAHRFLKRSVRYLMADVLHLEQRR